ncbi:MAG: guanylate kinase [Planctomycetota bacterium]|nr:guanylate kinase [Planctomycetota bacterium]
MGRGILFLVAGPAGVGKTTVLLRLVAEESGLVKAVSVTTRKPRPREVDGVAYHFWDEARFAAAVTRGEFLEHASVHGNRYGTLARFVEEQLQAGRDVVKDIDVQGVQQIRSLAQYHYPQTVAVFVTPPSREELVRRLRGRGSEDAGALALRLKTAEAEMERAHEYEYVVVNDSVETCVVRLKAIRVAEHCRQHSAPRRPG